jgi:hypothetical protein
MKTLLTTTAALSVGFILGAIQPIQAAALNGEGIFATKECSSVQFAAVKSERKPQDTREFERTPRDDIERFERDQMRLQQLEQTEQTDFERVQRDRERAIEREKKAAQQAESPNTTAPAPTSNNSVIPPDYDPAKIKQQAAAQGRELSPEEVQQIQNYGAQQGSSQGSAPQPTDPALGSMESPGYDPLQKKQQAAQQQAQ